MHQSAIVLHPFLKADEEFPEPIVPCACAFDDPATRWISPGSRGAFAAVADGECNAASGLPPRSPGSHTLCRDTSAAGDRASVGGVGRRGCPAWSSPLSCHACWRRSPRRPAGRRVGRSACGVSCRVCRDPSDWGLCGPPKGALTMTLSRDCQRHWILRNSSYRVSNLAHSRSKTPASTHAWKRRWHVEPDPYSRGKAFHWQPVRSMYRMPSMTWRKGTTGRPLAAMKV
jgi:hypothetical protein